MTYIGRPDMPEEMELSEEYSRLTEAFQGKPVTMRMLDLGSDKISLFQAEEREENPCMGNRSMRLLLKRPGVFRTQLRAMLRAARQDTTILFPMISGWHELEKIRTAVERMSEEFVLDGGEIRATVLYGLMVEVPSVVERFEDYVDNFDVFNIGTNDLTQYTLAADRNNENVAEYFKTFHPSVLSMIEKVCRIAAEKDKKVCVCGEMASELPLIPLLLGLGANCFSIPYHTVPKMKGFISTLDMGKCRELAQEALECRSTDEVEDILADYSDHYCTLAS
jgi:phosphoenolpyruvate-protein kinase (PTS system EI component)